MIKNYFKIAWRNLMKSKAFSFINILGLTIGITVCMAIYLFIINEFSADNFQKKQASVYRVMRRFDVSKNSAPFLSPNYAPALLNDFRGQIKAAVRVMPSRDLVSVGANAFKEKKVYFADPGFFQMFSFPLIKGNASTALENPSSVVLTESVARKYFGKEDPMGKTIELNKKRQLKVTGIIRDVPANSHMDFDLVIPLSNFYNEDWFKVWINNNLFTYVELDRQASQKQIESLFPQFMQKYMGEQMTKMRVHFDLTLRPLRDIYFESHSSFDSVRHGDKTVVFIFLSIAVLILVIACINFINLSTIRAVDRSREVGLRKVMGALRNHLMLQFIGESILLTGISCLLSMGLMELLMPMYNQLLGYNLVIPWNSWYVYLFIAGIMVMVGFLAGTYPAFFLSAFSPIEALKGKLKLGREGSLFRKALVLVQFCISVFLILGTIIVMSQMNYVKKKELGYNQEQTVVLPMENDEFYNGRNTFKNELLANHNIASVSFMSGEPGGFFDIHTFEAEGQKEIWKARTEFADFEMVKTLGLKIIAGRDFSPQFPTDSTDAVLINRTAADKLGFAPEQAVGKWIRNAIRDSARRRIVGVVEDFNFLSLKEKMDALVISPSDDLRVALVKLKPGNLKESLAIVKAAYNKVAPVYPFEYSFLDENFASIYKTDLRQQHILTIFAGLAIFIACLGLFGLASFATAKRTKEIGVRKVLGSSASNIVMLLTRDLLKPVLLATVITLPVGYYVMNNWLQNFAYRTPMHWWIFVLAAAIIAGIALLTVSIKAVNAALNNPVKSLRTE